MYTHAVVDRPLESHPCKVRTELGVERKEES